MTKTLNQILFSLHQNQNIFLEKNHNPPFKLNGRSLTDGRKQRQPNHNTTTYCVY